MKNTIFSNCIIPQFVLDKFGGIIRNNMRHLLPVEILLSCSITGNIITDDLYLTPEGYVVSWSSQAIPNMNSYISNSLLGRIQDVRPAAATLINLLGNKIRECLQWDQGIVLKSIPTIYYTVCLLSDKKRDSTVAIRSPSERVYERVVELRSIFAADPSYAMALAKLSQIATHENVKMGSGQGKECPLIQLRRDLNVPFVIDQSGNIYGLDLSFLDLSGKTFNGISFKDYCFAGTNLRRVTFNECKFYNCSFVGADVSSITFNECDFNECYEFIGTMRDDNCIIIRCSADDTSLVLLRKFFNIRSD